MDSILHTPRLQLSLITRAERGSRELNWLHELRSNELSMAWSIRPASHTLEETEKVVAGFLPPPSLAGECSERGGKEGARIAYAILRLSDDDNAQDESPRFIGLVTLTPLPHNHLALPPHLGVPVSETNNALVEELAYALLPCAWGCGYATEALAAVLRACRREESRVFWRPWGKVWMRAIVNGRNAVSRGVVRKCGVREMGVFGWKGERIFIGGEWRTEDELVVFGDWLVG